ncbi:hypothetical protein MPSI1_000068 [Malassezia psittaci]|uniref:Transport protein particle component n=1 Tax=Malassezia psittaci TaxID=1821823 RepID=A0AAF0F824_9BASI|nr:hypothetical protein MPSI1_000068 [Malassezia psittaci]
MQASVPSTVLGARPRRGPLVHDGVRSVLREQPIEIDRVCFEFLQIEMATTLAAGAAYKTRRANDIVAQLQIDDPHARVPPMLNKAEEAELAQNRMESVGMHVGACLVEQLVPNRLRTTQTLDNVKFVCKELWMALWDKQIDNLRTNHRGMFVLQDVAFRPLLHATNAPDYVAQLKVYRVFRLEK